MFILDLTASVRCPLSPLGQSLVTACSNGFGFTLKLADDNVTEGFGAIDDGGTCFEGILVEGILDTRIDTLRVF